MTTPAYRNDTEKKIIEFCLANPEMSNRQVAQALGVSKSLVGDYRKEHGLSRVVEGKADISIADMSDEEIASLVEEDRQLKKLKAKVSAGDRIYQHLLKQIDIAEERLRIALEIRDYIQPIKITADTSKGKGEATAIWLASDWHLEEKVDPHTINYLNEYSPTIAERRAKNFFRNGLKLVRKERQDVRIDNLILWIGGDIITNYLHEENEESNYMSPTEAILFAQDVLSGGLKLLSEEGDFKQIKVICNFGNHGRTTKRKRHSTGYKNNLEWMLYHQLSRWARIGHDNIQFQITNGYFNYAEIYNKTLRFHHGDNVNYQGGIGGVSIPLLKFIAKTNRQRWAHMDFLGHFHQEFPGDVFTMNGSLIGFNAYAQSIGASPEPAKQSFRLLDAKRGFTIAAPILVED